MTNAAGVTSTASVGTVVPGQQGIALKSLTFEPPLTKGMNTFSVRVTNSGGLVQNVKTYTAGRITGMRYEKGNPILIIGDSLSIPMSKLTQIRG